MTRQRPIRVTRRAAAQIQRAAAWWDENRPLAAGAVREELEEAFALLRHQPSVGPIAAGTRAVGIRRVHLSRIHHHLFYRIHGGAIEVLALWHVSRSTGPAV